MYLIDLQTVLFMFFLYNLSREHLPLLERRGSC